MAEPNIHTVKITRPRFVDEQSAPDPDPRVTIFDDDYGTGYISRLPWIFGPHVNPVRPTESHTTLNGHGALTLTWPANALDSVRWGGSLDVFASTGPVSEAWLIQELQFESNFSTGPADTTNHTGKIFALSQAGGVDSCGPIACPSSDWFARISWREPLTPTTFEVMNYNYYPEKTAFCGNNFVMTQGFQRETLYEFSLHVKLNSAAGVEDGIIETYVNGVNLTSQSNFKLYCGDESYRTAALIDNMANTMFYGGSGSGWGPHQDSSITLGRLRVQIPA
jgi:hypothetical protein